MSLLAPDHPHGNPAFALSSDEVDTVLDLVCRGAEEARAHVTPGMLEVPTTIIVRKAIRRVKRALGVTNLQVRGEQEIDDMASSVNRRRSLTPDRRPTLTPPSPFG